MGSEKEQFQHLNDRLASYIQRVREAGAGASAATLKGLLKDLEDEAARQRIFYEREIDKLRLQLEDASKSKNASEAEMEVQQRLVTTYKLKLEEGTMLYEERLNELNQANKRVIELEQEVAEARASAKGPQDKLFQMQGDIGKAMEKYDATNIELMKEREKFKNLQCQLNSTMQKTDFNKRSYEEQLKETNSRLDKAKKLVNDLEIQNKALETKNASIPGLLEQIRRKNDEELRAYREQTEYSNTRNMSEMKRQLDALSSLVDKLRTENNSFQSDSEESKTWMKAMETRTADLQAQKDALEAQLKAERERNKQQLMESETRLKELQTLVMEKMQESNESRDIQASLRAELETYRILLDEEEGKLGQGSRNGRGRSGGQMNGGQMSGGQMHCGQMSGGQMNGQGQGSRGGLRSQGMGANGYTQNNRMNSGGSGRFGSATSSKNMSASKRIMLRNMSTTYRSDYTPKFNTFTSSWDAKRGKKGDLPRVE